MHPSPGLQRKGKFEFIGVSVDLVVQQIAHQAGLVFSSSHVGRFFFFTSLPMVLKRTCFLVIIKHGAHTVRPLTTDILCIL